MKAKEVKLTFADGSYCYVSRDFIQSVSREWKTLVKLVKQENVK